MKEDATASSSSSSSAPGSYFGQLTMVWPETLSYRGSSWSPTHRADSSVLAEQVTLSLTPVERCNEPSALAAWFVNLVRPEIGADNATALQNLIGEKWEAGFRGLFEQVAQYRREQLEAALKQPS